MGTGGKGFDWDKCWEDLFKVYSLPAGGVGSGADGNADA